MKFKELFSSSSMKSSKKRIYKDLKFTQYAFYVMALLAIATQFMWITTSLDNPKYSTYSPVVTYHNLSFEQEEYFDYLIDRVHPYFMNATKTLDIYPSNTLIDCDSDYYDSHKIGCNLNGKIEMRFWGKYTEELLCHELLHNFILDEGVVKDLQGTGVCYE